MSLSIARIRILGSSWVWPMAPAHAFKAALFRRRPSNPLCASRAHQRSPTLFHSSTAMISLGPAVGRHTLITSTLATPSPNSQSAIHASGLWRSCSILVRFTARTSRGELASTSMGDGCGGIAACIVEYDALFGLSEHESDSSMWDSS